MSEVLLKTLEDQMAMAQFLHDDVNSNLAVLKMQLCHMCKHSKSRSQRRELRSMCELVDQLIASIRRRSSGIRQGADQERSLYIAIADSAHEFEQRTGIQTFFHSIGNDEDISNKISSTVLAILREALANIVRHARATEVHIRVERQTELLKLAIHDNADGHTGIQPERRRRFRPVQHPAAHERIRRKRLHSAVRDPRFRSSRANSSAPASTERFAVEAACRHGATHHRDFYSG
jgi:signal transduction histidine kinase